jgi:hypothetical protein
LRRNHLISTMPRKEYPGFLLSVKNTWLQAPLEL